MPEQLPLSDLIERLAGDGPLDEAFVRALGAWLHGKASHLTIPLVDRLGLRDVVVTFKMQRKVRLLITGYPDNDLPGEVTVAVDERDFPELILTVLDDPRADPYEFATLDYSVADRAVRITGGPHDGSLGKLLMSATIGIREEHRIELTDGRIVKLGPEVVAFTE